MWKIKTDELRFASLLYSHLTGKNDVDLIRGKLMASLLIVDDSASTRLILKTILAKFINFLQETTLFTEWRNGEAPQQESMRSIETMLPKGIPRILILKFNVPAR